MSETFAGAVPGVIILAGGFGTRVSHLLPGLPKPMAPVAGRPFVEWVVRYFRRWGCREFALATGHLASVIENHFQSQPVPGATVVCRLEQTPLGTAGGCINALPASGGGTRDAIWLVVNGDSLVFADPRPVVEALSSSVAESSPSPKGTSAEAALLGLQLDDAGRFGSLDILPNGMLRAFREKQAGPGIINAGVYAFTERSLRSLPSRRPLSFEFDVFPDLAARGKMRAVTATAPFLDIGTPATLTEAEQFILTHQAHFV